MNIQLDYSGHKSACPKMAITTYIVGTEISCRARRVTGNPGISFLVYQLIESHIIDDNLHLEQSTIGKLFLDLHCHLSKKFLL